MWKVFQGDPLDIQLECLDDNEDPVDISAYTVSVNLVWGDDDDERIEFETGDLEINGPEGIVIAPVESDDIESLPLGNKTKVFLVLTPSDASQFTTYLGKITVYDA